MEEHGINSDIDPEAEIDPDLFVKCRLCVTRKGLYQIVPAVQDQIKFCFDISVKVFDGLPQVLCKNCKITLNQYQLTKKTFINNQALLEEMQKRKVKAVDVDANVNVNVDVGVDEDVDTDKEIVQAKKYKRRRIRIESDSSESQADKQHFKVEQEPSSDNLSWKSMYDKNFVCRFCGGVFHTQRRLTAHKMYHKNLLSTYEQYKINHCTVRLDKIDLRPNLTGDTTTVVLSPSNIISEPCDPTYFISYVPSKGDSNESCMDLRPTAPKRAKLHSRSTSRDTVVIEDADDDSRHFDNRIVSAQGDVKESNGFISVDDSSTNDSINIQSNEPIQLQSELHQSDLKIIYNIISMCQSKYATEKKSKKTKESSALVRKLLSIGTKVMSGPGCVIASPGLLKYLEHENLYTQWAPTAAVAQNSNYVRISTAVDSKKDVNSGWSILATKEETGNISVTNNDHSYVAPQMEIPKPSVEKQELTSVRVYSKAEITPLRHSPDSDAIGKKLLNANPVNNPKKLPKKLLNADVKSIIASVKVSNKGNDNSDSNMILIESDDDEVPSEMPVITSTESLAVSDAAAADRNPVRNASARAEDNTVDTNRTIPRLKCKPVTELMAETASPLLSLRHPVPTSQNVALAIVPPVSNGVIQLPGNVRLQLIQQSPTNMQTTTSNTLTTNKLNNTTPTESNRILPNSSNEQGFKVTSSSTAAEEDPVTCLKALLQEKYLYLVSNISKEQLKSFTCLVKFKLDVRQQDKSVVISLALYGLKKQFSIKLKKPNNEEMYIDSLPAHWQKTIIKNFQGQVSEKILNCAMKTSPELLENAKIFVAAMKQTATKMDLKRK